MKTMRPDSVRRARSAALAEQRRYDAWLAKHACQPAPSYPDPFAIRYADGPAGLAVLYYSTGTKPSPTTSFWMVP